MDSNELLERYNLLLAENRRLEKENCRLRAQLARPEPVLPGFASAAAGNEAISGDDAPDRNLFAAVTSHSDTAAKIDLFRSLFKGRADVYAKRWENSGKGTSGYWPVCLNQWQSGLCNKPHGTCAKCTNKRYAPLDEEVIENHLRGSIVAGVYPMLPDETCSFLAMDFDEGDWPRDISVLRELCTEFAIPFAAERSRSGAGGHLWFFLANPVSAAIVRKFGTALLTCAMSRRHEIQFTSYDRLFPSQDTLPKGGLGNLIALPLQKAARENGNSAFVDADFKPYHDQWAFLSTVGTIPESRLDHLIASLCPGHELGALKIDEEEEREKPWERRRQESSLQQIDFPRQLEIVKANMLFIPKAGISQRALNRLKRLASFNNPMFYRQQAMRLPTHGHPRVISCADETEEYLGLPRGCEPELRALFAELGTDLLFIDKTYQGKRIDVEFVGQLRDEQSLALDQLLAHDTGILSGTTAFGKTVVAIKLIAERKVNTLILVDKVSLLAQWQAKLAEFLIVNEPLPEQPAPEKKKKGRKKKRDIIGQLGGGKNSLSGIVDIAVMQSLSRKGEVKDCVKNYGMIIADECHHASAFTYEQILKTAPAKYVYGLTATPARKDGHHPILFMQCGPIRYRDDPRKQAASRPFDHYVVPRFTGFSLPPVGDGKELSIQELYAELVENDFRNQLIVDDVLANYRQGRNCLVLSLRTAHVAALAEKLQEEVAEVILLTGGMGKKATKEAFRQLADLPAEKKFVLVATGSFIGEGFDEPRLDTLFLAMPISWKGTLQQYAGRLHRLFAAKKEVRIYDYVDIQIRMLEKMYQRRLNGYALMGYQAKGGEMIEAAPDIIFSENNFLPVFHQDIVAAQKEIVIVSPFVRKLRASRMARNLKVATARDLSVIVVTRPKEDFPAKDHAALQRTLDLLTMSGVKVVFQANIHQKFAVMDRKIVWYGSINLLSYGSARESIMRIAGPNIANALLKSIALQHGGERHDGIVDQ